MSKMDREAIAKCLFNHALAGHAQWNDMSGPNKNDWRARADAWMLDVAALKEKRAQLGGANAEAAA